MPPPIKDLRIASTAPLVSPGTLAAEIPISVGAAHEYANFLEGETRRYGEHLLIVMRIYFEKPRTTTGWKGLINDPHLDGSFDVETGLRMSRTLLGGLAERGMPAASEVLDPISQQYFGELLAWAAIGART